MENNETEILEVENTPENVEETTEETVVEETTVEQPVVEQPKMFTQEQVNEMMGKAKARARAKTEREYQRKYGNLMDVLKAGTGVESVDEMTDTFQKFYASKGVTFAEKPNYSAKDIEVLARAEANEFIQSGFDDVVEEVDRLAEIGFENMTAREKATFKVLAEYRQSAERSRELSRLGVSEDLSSSKEFMDFAGKFNANTSMKDIYDIYQKMKPKKEIHTMGSMKQAPETKEKDYYTPAEIEKLTEEDLRDPKVWANVRRSMTGG